MSIFANSRMSGNVRASGSMDCRYSGRYFCRICGEVSNRKHKNDNGEPCEGKVTKTDGFTPSWMNDMGKVKNSSGGGYGGSSSNEA